MQEVSERIQTHSHKEMRIKAIGTIFHLPAWQRLKSVMKPSDGKSVEIDTPFIIRV